MNESEFANFEEVWRRVAAAKEAPPVPEPVAVPSPAPLPRPIRAMRFLPEM